MQAFWDEQHIDRWRRKWTASRGRWTTASPTMRSEFAAVRSDAREDFRTLLGVLLAMFMAMILGFAGILLQHL